MKRVIRLVMAGALLCTLVLVTKPVFAETDDAEVALTTQDSLVQQDEFDAGEPGSGSGENLSENNGETSEEDDLEEEKKTEEEETDTEDAEEVVDGIAPEEKTEALSEETGGQSSEKAITPDEESDEVEKQEEEIPEQVKASPRRMMLSASGTANSVVPATLSAASPASQSTSQPTSQVLSPTTSTQTSTTETKASTPKEKETASASQPKAETSAAASPKVKHGIFSEGGHLRYYDEKGKLRKTAGWITYNGKKYFADANGWLYQDIVITFGPRTGYYMGKDGSAQESIREWAGNLRYFDKNGRRKDNHGWVNRDGKSYFADASGYLYRNQVISFGNKKFYYMDKDGSSKRGTATWLGNLRYFDGNGYLKRDSGWINDGSKRYFADANGSLYHDQVITFGPKKTYYMGSDGTVRSGSVWYNGALRFFDGEGFLKKDVGWVSFKGKKYFANEQGALYHDQVITFGPKRAYYMNSSGASEEKVMEWQDELCYFDGTGFYKKGVTWAELDKQKFVDHTATYVKKYASKYGVRVHSPIIAQAILESGWGKSELASKYNNYYGLKCGSGWKGPSVNMRTKEEYEPGVETSIYDNFRVYRNMEEGVKGYFEFIQYPRYQNLRGITDPRKYLETIRADGYATSSTYVDTNMRLIKENNLTKYDGGKK